MGMAGGSGSGKSTVQRKILGAFGPDQISLLDHDSYYRDLSHLPPEKRAGFNFDHPDALETELMVRHLDALIRGFPIEKPTYDFAAHARKEETETVHPRRVIMVEGILVLAEEELRERMDIRIFVDAPDDIRLMRRIRRDLQERGRSIDSILKQYQEFVRPMHIEFVEPSKRTADIIIPRGGKNRVALEMVLARINHLLAGSAPLLDWDGV
ncbi:MAG: uridine kinase [Bacteroidota bacterium]